MADDDNAESSEDFQVHISLAPTDGFSDVEFDLPIVPENIKEKYIKDGFAVFPNLLSGDAVDELNDRLEDILRGSFDRNKKPDKAPKLLKSSKPGTKTTSNSKDSRTHKKVKQRPPAAGPIGFSGNLQNVKVLQVINAHKADSLFRKLDTDPQLGSLVAQLAGWDGARLAQDQIWAKPPGASPLVFHRDSPYFMFEPDDVVTCWIALDDMDEELGPLEYVRGSHKWGHGRWGSANVFFQQNSKNLLRSAAEKEGIDPDSLEFVSMKGLKRGGMSIHNGRCWHGSDENKSKTRPRRGLGIHFVPSNARFTSDASHSKLWKSYVADVDDPSTVELPEEDFPVTAYKNSD